jgi:predicted choloylglycine hydrolase
MGCSALMAAGVYARNYDFGVRRYDGILTAVQADGVYASIGFSDRFTGRLDGMNEHGLCVGLHFVNEAIGRPGLVCLLLVRLVLDQCATTAEAIALLRRLPHGLGFNYSLLDATGNAAVVEAAPGALAVRQGEWLACTNHFQAPALLAYNRRTTGHSRRRLPPLQAWAAHGLSAEALFRALNDSTSPAFHHAYDKGFGTLHTIVCEPASRTMLIGIGGDALPTRVDVAAWTRGAALPVMHLQGALGTPRLAGG